jgi:hypothetical protein
MTQLLTPTLRGLIDLPPTPISPLELQMMELADRVMALEALTRQLQSKQNISKATDLKNLVVPEQVGVKSSPVSSRVSNDGCDDTPEFDKYVLPLLKTRPSGGYYFPSGDLGQPEQIDIIHAQAKQLGFKSDTIKVKGKSTRIWLNKDYILKSV